MTYNVSSETLNTTIPYHTIQFAFQRQHLRRRLCASIYSKLIKLARASITVECRWSTKIITILDELALTSDTACYRHFDGPVQLTAGECRSVSMHRNTIAYISTCQKSMLSSQIFGSTVDHRETLLSDLLLELKMMTNL